ERGRKGSGTAEAILKAIFKNIGESDDFDIVGSVKDIPNCGGATAAATNHSGFQFLIGESAHQLGADDLKGRGCGSGFGEGSAGNGVVFHSAPQTRLFYLK